MVTCIDNITEALGEYSKDPASHASRKQLLEAARSLVADLETPGEKLGRIGWFEVQRYASMKVAIDLGVFERMAENGASPKSVAELAKTAGAETRLLERLMRIMAADHMVTETASSEYALNGFSRLLIDPVYQGLVNDTFNAAIPCSYALPEFLKRTKYRDPTNKDDTAFKLAHKTDLHYFEWLHAPGHEQDLQAFNNHMTAKNQIDQKRWFDVVPVKQVLGQARAADAPLLVDVGGNVGHDLIALRKTVPDLFGKLVLQDLPGPVNAAKLPEGIEKADYDFFTPQPIKGARAYYLHMVLHDWPDDKCREILKNQIPAMEKGYSKILINDIVIPDKGAGWVVSGIDILMMTVHSATERTETEWRKLLESVGLRLTKLWDCEGEAEKLIEAELA